MPDGWASPQLERPGPCSSTAWQSPARGSRRAGTSDDHGQVPSAAQRVASGTVTPGKPSWRRCGPSRRPPGEELRRHLTAGGVPPLTLAGQHPLEAGEPGRAGPSRRSPSMPPGWRRSNLATAEHTAGSLRPVLLPRRTWPGGRGQADVARRAWPGWRSRLGTLRGLGQVVRAAARCAPVSVAREATSSAGVPSKTIRPPSWPAPGPRSMIQSACAITA